MNPLFLLMQIVYIPADQSQALEEWTVAISPGKKIECLTNRLKGHFQAATPSASAEEKEAQREAIRQQLQEKMPGGATVPSELVDHFALMSTVDTVPLLVNKAAHDYIGVFLYVDDQGVIKNLPLNERASLVAMAAGNPLRVMGDAFLGMIYDNDDDFERLDFTLDTLKNGERAGWAGVTSLRQTLMDPGFRWRMSRTQKDLAWDEFKTWPRPADEGPWVMGPDDDDEEGEQIDA